MVTPFSSRHCLPPVNEDFSFTDNITQRRTDEKTGSSDAYYVTGYTYGSLDVIPSAGSQDMFLVKYNAAGTKQWTRQLGTSSDEHGYGIAVDAGGNVYVTGQTAGGLDGNTSAGGNDMFLVKYNSSGVKQ